VYYLNARYYNPELRRFSNSDRLLTGNLFSYCMNAPTMRTDSTGNFSIGALIGAIGAAVAAIVTAAIVSAVSVNKKKTAVTPKSAGVTVTSDSKTVIIYGSYANDIAEMVQTSSYTYTDYDCQKAVRKVIPGNNLKHGSGGMWANNLSNKWKDESYASAQAGHLVFSACPAEKHALQQGNCPDYKDDHKGHVGLVVPVDWHDGNGIVLSVYQSCAPSTHPPKALWENDGLGGPNITGFSDLMVYFGVIDPAFLGE
jgi:hypothetical protein